VKTELSPFFDEKLHVKHALLSLCLVGALLGGCDASNDMKSVSPQASLSRENEEILFQLLVAAAGDDVPTLKQLLDGDARPLLNARGRGTGETALYRAVDFGQIDAVNFLLGRGADPNLPNSHGMTAIWAASFKGNSAMVRVLIGAGANVEIADQEYGITPLIAAAWRGHPDVVRQLLAAKVNVNTRAKDGNTALSRASNAGHNEIVKLLLQAGAQ
jgi:ankyrin repeat protein